jgi:hypothetical protein
MGCRSIRCRPDYRSIAIENEQANCATLPVFLSQSAGSDPNFAHKSRQRIGESTKRIGAPPQLDGAIKTLRLSNFATISLCPEPGKPQNDLPYAKLPDFCHFLAKVPAEGISGWL